MENMNNTMELLAGKVSEVEEKLYGLGDVVNQNAVANNTNAEIIENWTKITDVKVIDLVKKYGNIKRFILVGAIAGGYLLYKQFKKHEEKMAVMEAELGRLKLERVKAQDDVEK